MIIFDLSCSADHRFEGWFRSAEDFGRQEAQGMVHCPYCGTHDVRRLPSAAHLVSSSGPAPEAASASTDPLAQARDFIEEMIRHSEDVGNAFAEEARRIHYHEAPERSIRGVASTDERAALREEGIDVLCLPRPKRPEDLN
ncbi:MAG: DUF1178 family protein [Azospira sp.]|jgi:hypothetical protein|nr:DUF1178 family protein [Azospira sp.]